MREPLLPLRCALWPLLLIAGCAAPVATVDKPAADGASAELAGKFERESAALLEAYAVTDADGFFSSSVTAANPPTVSNSGANYAIEWSIGTDIPVTCILYTSEVDAAHSLAAMHATLFAQLPEHEIHSIDAGALAGKPMLAVNTLYTAEQQGMRSLGWIKLLWVALPESGLACVHDEPGLRETFKRQVATLVGQLRLSKVPPGDTTLQQQQIAVLRVGERVLGYNHVGSYLTQNGLPLEVAKTATLVAGEGGRLHAVDATKVELSSLDGRLLHAGYVTVQEGKLQRNLTLDSLAATAVESPAAGGYRVTGSEGEERVETTLPAAPPLSSEFGWRAAIAAHGGAIGVAHAWQHHGYNPDANVLAATSATLHVVGVGPDGTVGFSSRRDSDRFEGELSVQGMVRELRFKVGAAEGKLTEVFATVVAQEQTR